MNISKLVSKSGNTSSSTTTPSSINDDVFSVVSDVSSQSSNGESDDEHRRRPQIERMKQQFQHPRRSVTATLPPPLPRQDERKSVFVQDLVDSATNMVSVIWPMSNAPCVQASGNKGVLPLRRYIEETLRRSRTSYSTLQVALYYLVLIKPHVAKPDFYVDPSINAISLRAVHCGRRMFLAALILASKYLQDRNYSAKAWSKMSGLKTQEINVNERIFLSAVNWKLHVPDSVFKKWADIVLRFTTPTASVPSGLALWAKVIGLLTPELDDPRLMSLSVKPETARSFDVSFSPSDSNTLAELKVRTSATPEARRQHVLPTPQMTPTSAGISTPAASVYGSGSSMSAAMTAAQAHALHRIACDKMSVPMSRSSGYKHAMMLSPESMTSKTSRRSSISSPLAGAPGIRLAATSGMTTGSIDCPITISDDELSCSPVSILSVRPVTSDKTIARKRGFCEINRETSNDGASTVQPCHLLREDARVTIDLTSDSSKRICI